MHAQAEEACLLIYLVSYVSLNSALKITVYGD